MKNPKGDKNNGKWPQVRLGDICDYHIARTPPSNLTINNYISTENILPNKSGITVSSGLPSIKFVSEYPKDATLVSNIRPYFKKIWYATENGGCSNDVLIFRAKSNCYPKFLYYLLSEDKFFDYATLTSKGTKMPRGDKTAIMRYPVPCVPRENQRAIAATLSCLDDKIALNSQINHHLEQMTQAIFKSWFVDFEPFGDGRFVDSELGRMPEGWKVGKFTNIVNVLGGGTPKTNDSKYWEGNIPFFTPKDINGIFVVATEKCITQEGLEKCNSKLYPKNSVFITARGTVGKIVFAGCDMAMSQTSYALIGTDHYSQYFVYGLAQKISGRLKHKAIGAVFDAIVTRDFENELIIIPPGKVVNQYSSITQPLYSQILALGKQSRALAAIRDALLPKLMSGELSVADI
jgi:type I restriction enzyme S subunit